MDPERTPGCKGKMSSCWRDYSKVPGTKKALPRELSPGRVKEDLRVVSSTKLTRPGLILRRVPV